jgi:hypothetical protein
MEMLVFEHYPCSIGTLIFRSFRVQKTYTMSLWSDEANEPMKLEVSGQVPGQEEHLVWVLMDQNSKLNRTQRKWLRAFLNSLPEHADFPQALRQRVQRQI